MLVRTHTLNMLVRTHAHSTKSNAALIGSMHLLQNAILTQFFDIIYIFEISHNYLVLITFLTHI